MVRRRSRALAARAIAPTGCPPTRTSPRLGSSRVPAMVSRVLLPEPLGPMTATISPRSTDRLTACSAFTEALPSPYDLDTSLSSSRLIVVFSLLAGAVAAALVSDSAGRVRGDRVHHLDVQHFLSVSQPRRGGPAKPGPTPRPPAGGARNACRIATSPRPTPATT